MCGCKPWLEIIVVCECSRQSRKLLSMSFAEGHNCECESKCRHRGLEVRFDCAFMCLCPE